MKKILLVLFCQCLGVMAAFAQAETLTADELRFRNGLEQFLREEGYVPTIDSDDNSLNFKKEGVQYWILVIGNSPTYLEFHRAGLSLDEFKRSLIVKAANQATYDTRCAKAYVAKSSVAFTIEVYCQTVEDFKNIFYDSLSALDHVRNKTKEYYNKLDQ